MSSIERPLSGDVLRFHLADEGTRLNDPVQLQRRGRNARALAKNGPLRLTLIRVRAGGKIAPHRAAGPITVQVLDGDIEFHAAGKEYRLGAGDLLVLNAGLEHEVASETGGTFLLTVVQPNANEAEVDDPHA